MNIYSIIDTSSDTQIHLNFKGSIHKKKKLTLSDVCVVVYVANKYEQNYFALYMQMFERSHSHHITTGSGSLY